MSMQTQFTKLIQDIEPSATTKSNASNAQRTLRSYLADHDDFGTVHVETYLSGSYARDTSIRPRVKDGVERKPDIDIIVVVDYTRDDDPEDVLDLLRRTLGDKYELEERINDRSVGVVTATVKMDVVPIIEDGVTRDLYVADRSLGDWVLTNPPGHKQWATEVNKQSNGRFKPLVKLFKWWRREHPTADGTNRPKGFVIERLVADCMDNYETQYAELFARTLETIRDKYSVHYAAGIVPSIPDPSVPNNDVMARLTFDEFAAFYEKVREHAELAREAIEESDPDTAFEKWREILPRLPARERSASSLLSSLAGGSSLAFPDRPVMPKKPEGFA